MYFVYRRRALFSGNCVNFAAASLNIKIEVKISGSLKTNECLRSNKLYWSNEAGEQVEYDIE